MSEESDRAPRAGWLTSARELFSPPQLNEEELAEYTAWSNGRVIERFRRGLPMGVVVPLALAYFYWDDATADARQTVMGAAGIAAATLTLTIPITYSAVFRARPNALVLPVSLILSAAIAAVASTDGAFEGIAAALALLIYIYGSVLTPLPPRTLLMDIAAQQIVITTGVWMGTTTVPWMYLGLTLSGIVLTGSGAFMRENGDRRSFVAHRRLDAAHSLLADKQAELASLNAELEERVERQLDEIIAHSRNVDELNAQLQQRVKRRSKELALALDRLTSGNREPSAQFILPGTVIGERAKVIRPLGEGGIGRPCLPTLALATGERQGPLSNRACGLPAHGLPVVCRLAALRSLPKGLLRIADGSTQSMKA